jgi:hypothetical protein
METLKTLGQIAGIAGISLGVLLILFKEVIRKNIFPNLSPEDGYKLLRLLLIFVWTIAILGVLAWTYLEIIRTANNRANNIETQNPYGEEEVLLNGTELLLSNKDMLTKHDDNKISYLKYLFQIDTPNAKSGFKYHLVTAKEYANLLSRDTSFLSLNSFLNINPVLRDANVFRIYKESPFDVTLTDSSYEGTKVADEEYKKAKEMVGNNPWDEISKHLSETKDDNHPANIKIDTAKVVEGIKHINIDSIQRNIFNSLPDEAKHIRFYNELAILIVDRNKFELQSIAVNGGVKVEANPLNYLLSFGAVLPQFNPKFVKEISVSKDSYVWGFYGQRKLNNVIINGSNINELYTDYYRIYAVNSDFIYQITLSYTPNLSTPRSTWDDLLKFLKSLRIVSNQKDNSL